VKGNGHHVVDDRGARGRHLSESEAFVAEIRLPGERASAGRDHDGIDLRLTRRQNVVAGDMAIGAQIFSVSDGDRVVWFPVDRAPHATGNDRPKVVHRSAVFQRACRRRAWRAADDWR
jgi:hypothetical protein